MPRRLTEAVAAALMVASLSLCMIVGLIVTATHATMAAPLPV